LCKKAETDYEGFWAEQARGLISWKTPFTKTLNQVQAPFSNGLKTERLTLRTTVSDRNIEKGLTATKLP
jgi:acetyl-CoA synthetase